VNAHTKIEAAKPTGLALLREPFPANLISKLPKPTRGRCAKGPGANAVDGGHLPRTSTMSAMPH
jgi:hypothetical protein